MRKPILLPAYVELFLMGKAGAATLIKNRSLVLFAPRPAGGI